MRDGGLHKRAAEVLHLDPRYERCPGKGFDKVLRSGSDFDGHTWVKDGLCDDCHQKVRAARGKPVAHYRRRA